jgi:hypothetical protein
MVLGAVSPTPELLELAIKRATKQSPIGVIGGRSTTARESFERGNSPKNACCWMTWSHVVARSRR